MLARSQECQESIARPSLKSRFSVDTGLGWANREVVDAVEGMAKGKDRICQLDVGRVPMSTEAVGIWI